MELCCQTGLRKRFRNENLCGNTYCYLCYHNRHEQLCDTCQLWHCDECVNESKCGECDTFICKWCVFRHMEDDEHICTEKCCVHMKGEKLSLRKKEQEGKIKEEKLNGFKEGDIKFEDGNFKCNKCDEVKDKSYFLWKCPTGKNKVFKNTKVCGKMFCTKCIACKHSPLCTVCDLAFCEECVISSKFPYCGHFICGRCYFTHIEDEDHDCQKEWSETWCTSIGNKLGNEASYEIKCTQVYWKDML